MNLICSFIDIYKELFQKNHIKNLATGHLILCPFHADTEPSLQINNNGIAYCHAEKKAYPLLAVIKKYAELYPEFSGLLEDFTYPTDSNLKESEVMKIVNDCWYEYTNEDGQIVYFRKRLDYETKGKKCKAFYFYEQKPDGTLELIKGWQPILLYRLDEVIKSEKVIFVEGEQCVDALRELGFTATTLPVGATKKLNKDILKAFTFLKDKEVIIFPDNDEPGLAYADAISKHLRGIAKTVNVARCPDLGIGSDIADYINYLKALGKTESEIKEEVNELILVEPEFLLASEIQPRKTEWNITDYLPAGKITLLAGEPGIGKTSFAIMLTAIASKGREVITGFKDGVPVIQSVTEQKIAFISLEDPPEELVSILNQYDAKLENIFFYNEDSNTTPFAFAKKAIEMGCSIIFVDHILLLAGSKSLNSSSDVKSIIQPFIKLAKKTGISICLLHHLNKSKSGNPLQDVHGSVAFTALAKRILLLTRTEAGILLTFQKLKKTEPLKIKIGDDRVVQFIGNGEDYKEAHDEKLKEKVSKKERAKSLILKLLDDNPSGIEYKELLKYADVEGLNKFDINHAREELKDKIKVTPIKNEKNQIVGWIWKSQIPDTKTWYLDKTLENTITRPDTTNIKKCTTFFDDTKTSKKSITYEDEKFCGYFFNNLVSGKDGLKSSFEPDTNKSELVSGKSELSPPKNNKPDYWDAYREATKHINFSECWYEDEDGELICYREPIIMPNPLTYNPKPFKYVIGWINEHKDKIPTEPPPLDAFLAHLKRQADRFNPLIPYFDIDA